MTRPEISKLQRQEEAARNNKIGAGRLMAEIRLHFRLMTVKEAEAKFKAPILAGKLEKLEAGDNTSGFSIYRAALNEFRTMCKRKSSKRAAEFLERIDTLYPKLTR